MKNDKPEWARAIVWDCERVKKYLEEGVIPLLPVAARMLEAHISSCDMCHKLIDEEARRHAPDWIQPWLSGEINLEELMRRRSQQGK